MRVAGQWRYACLVIDECGLRLEQREGGWRLAGPHAAEFGAVDEYLGYLADRNYSPRTVRAYGFDLLAFCRWLSDVGLTVDAVTTEALLDYLLRPEIVGIFWLTCGNVWRASLG